METVAIFGVGLIGGSFALALRKAGFSGRILGVGSPTTIAKAMDRHVIDSGADLAGAAQQADLIYLAQPISRILETIPLLNEHVSPAALVTDAGSTKSQIIEAASRSLTRCRFLGGHPMAGKETRGVESADADLFQGRPYVLTPGSPADEQVPVIQEFLDWVRRIGANPFWMDPVGHDITVSYTSHLPQLASTALAAALSKQGDDTQRIFGPALIDSTRLALSPFDIWADILDTNAAAIDVALTSYIAELQFMKQVLAMRAIGPVFNRASEFATALRSGLIPKP